VRWQEQALGKYPSDCSQQKPEYAKDDKPMWAKKLAEQAGKEAEARSEKHNLGAPV